MQIEMNFGRKKGIRSILYVTEKKCIADAYKRNAVIHVAKFIAIALGTDKSRNHRNTMEGIRPDTVSDRQKSVCT